MNKVKRISQRFVVKHIPMKNWKELAADRNDVTNWLKNDMKNERRTDNKMYMP